MHHNQKYPMKKFISFLSAIIILTSCTKQDILEDAQQQQQSVLEITEMPVSFTYSSPECERPEITFEGETYSDVTVITSDSTINLRSDQKYTVSFKLVKERCTAGALILGGEKSDEVNLWLGSRSEIAKKEHINLEAKYFVMTLGE